MPPSFLPPNDRIRPYITQNENGKFIVKENAPKAIRNEAEAFIEEIEQTQDIAYGQQQKRRLPKKG